MEDNMSQNANTAPARKNKVFLIAGVIVIVIIGSFFLGKQTNAPANREYLEEDKTTSPVSPEETTTVSGSSVKTPVTSPKSSTGSKDTTFGSGQVTTLGKQPMVLVTLTDNGFAPLSLQVEVGQPISFTNQSSSGMWVASNPHPAHTGYAGFDQNKVVFRGESYEFTFTKAGTWKYHNHVNPSQTGTIIVK